MLTIDGLRAFLVSKGITAQIEGYDPAIDLADEVVILNPTGGVDDTYEGEFNRPSLQVRTRGLQGDEASAEALADNVDQAFMRTLRPQIGGRYVTKIERIGGPPAFLARDDANRTVLVANYLLEIEA